eukprot:scaffold9354_cov37-Prasinocladus_malaysianus.AAC.1
MATARRSSQGAFVSMDELLTMPFDQLRGEVSSSMNSVAAPSTRSYLPGSGGRVASHSGHTPGLRNGPAYPPLPE